MGKMLLLLVIVITLSVLMVRNNRNNRNVITRLSKVIKDINNMYIDIFTKGKFIRRVIEGALILVAELSTTFTMLIAILKGRDNLNIHISILFVTAILVIILIHYGIGYILYISSKIHEFISAVEDVSVKVEMILSYFIISTYFAVLIIFPNEFKESYIIGFIGIGLSYLLCISVLIKLIKNPNYVKSSGETSFNRIIIASILIVIMIIANLFLAVSLTYYGDTKAFTNVGGVFDLFYYTIITFTTIGYGDIVPVTNAAKIISMIIAVTSVICITIFISTVLSNKEKVE